MCMWRYVWTLLLITVFGYNVWHSHAEVWSKSRPDFDTPVSKSGRSFDQTSTLGGRSLVEISTKLLPPQCRSLVEVWSKFGRNSDPPQCRSLVEVWSKFGRSLAEVWCRSFVNILSNLLYFIDIPNKLRPNFDTGGVEVWSKFGLKFGRSLVEISAKLRHPSVEYMHI